VIDKEQSGIQDMLTDKWSVEKISRSQCKKQSDCRWWWFGNDGFLECAQYISTTAENSSNFEKCVIAKIFSSIPGKSVFVFIICHNIAFR
jgi:hypothetical protein